MTYSQVIPARFIRRINRFLAAVLVDGREEIVHVKNTGRCRELLVQDGVVWLAKSDNPARKTVYDLVAVEKQRENGTSLLINMDSQAPNAAVARWLAGGLFSSKAVVRREVTHGDSRFDFYVEDGHRRVFVEVKGVTLEQDGVAAFPDAPTERGLKHLHGLISCLDEGFEAIVLFVIQMKSVHLMRPNDKTHKAFGDALRQAAKAGVQVLAVDCVVTPMSMTIDSPVSIQL